MTQSQAQALSSALTGASIFIGIFSLAVLVFFIIVYWRIVAKMGYPGVMSLLLLIPIVNIIMICMVAFSEWPIHRELNQLRQQVGMRGPQGPQGPYYPQGSQYPPQ